MKLPKYVMSWAKSNKLMGKCWQETKNLLFRHFFQCYILGDATKMSLQRCQTNMTYMPHYKVTLSIYQPTSAEGLVMLFYAIKFLKIPLLCMVSIQD